LFPPCFSGILSTVTATSYNESDSTDQLLLRALIISLLIHLTVFGVWKWGQKEGWWLNFHFPAWMHLSPKLISPLNPKKLAPAPKQDLQPPQLTFVDVDPALADVAPPKAPKFYSANNSVAANPTPKNAPVPEILGHQTKVIKTTPNVVVKPQPLEPAPPQKEIVKTPEAKPLPQKALTPGDLAMAKPLEKPQEKDGKADAAQAEETKPQPAVHQRPRTIAEAMAQKGMLGDKSRQDGGVQQLKMDSTLDAMKTSYGDYDREFIDAVRTHWYQLLENRAAGTGKVVVEFRMLPDGRITNLKIVQNEVSDLYALLCQQAIFEPAPYRRWPDEMRRDIGKEYRDVTFTFYYSSE
jgi:outer membrane biosynthesis protein TonB